MPFPDGERQHPHTPHGAKVQNKLLSASLLTAVYLLLGGNLRFGNHVRWLMFSDGTDSQSIHYLIVKDEG